MPHDEGPEIMQAKLEKCQWYGKSNNLIAEIKSDPISSKFSHKTPAVLFSLDLIQGWTNF